MIVPAKDPRRLQRRRAITLDLFTRHGEAWTGISNIRHEWSITAVVAVPPAEPPFQAEAIGLMSRLQMPERFHLPQFPSTDTLAAIKEMLAQRGEELPQAVAEDMEVSHRQGYAGRFLLALRDLCRAIVPEANPSGTDVMAWLTWAPFLSACALYDPPELDLLAFADHDDHAAARLRQLTFYRDTEEALDVERWRSSAVSKAGTLQDQMIVHALGAQRMVSTYKPSTMPAPPARPRSRPRLDDLVAVQCAIFKRHKWTYPVIAAHFGWSMRPDSYDTRRRANRAMDHVKRGEQILACRK